MDEFDSIKLKTSYKRHLKESGKSNYKLGEDIFLICIKNI